MSKNIKVAIGAVILVVIIALIARGNMDKKATPLEVAPAPVIEAPVASKSTKWVAPKPAPVPAMDTRSYTELVSIYKDRIVQFGDFCQVRISEQVYKVGSEVFLDNRNNTSLTIKIGLNTYDLGAYGYKVVTLDTEGKFMIDCGVNQNVAILTVQK